MLQLDKCSTFCQQPQASYTSQTYLTCSCHACHLPHDPFAEHVHGVCHLALSLESASLASNIMPATALASLQLP